MRTEFKKMMDYCTYCPKMCRFSCPVSEVSKRESHTPWGKMQLAGMLTEKQMVLSQENTLPLYECTNCLRCQNYCEHQNDVPEALREVRQMAVANYSAPAGVFEVGENFAKHNNPYGSPLWERKGLVPEALKAKKKKRGLFFPSCHTLKFFPARLGVYAELFQKLGVKDMVMHPSPLSCCGEPLRALGFEKEFSEIAEVNYFNLKGYDFWVTDDAECCFSLRKHYADEGFNFPFPVYHLLEYLNPFLHKSNYRTHGKIKARFVFHDSSFLSRHLGLVDLPRKMLRHVTGFTPLNMAQWGEDTLGSPCEGGYQWVFPKNSEKIARKIIAEVESRRIKTLITASVPAEALWKRLAKNTQIIDIFEFINQQIL